MPLTIGTKNIIGIYKGGKEIDKVYKGTTLLYGWSWEQWYQEYIYNALIPETINSKNVKNRAKVQTIYGNSVVENQLCYGGDFVDLSWWSKNRITMTSSNGIATCVSNSNAYSQVSGYHNFHAGEIIKGHTYLLSAYIKITSGLCSAIKVFNHSNTQTIISNPTLNVWYHLTNIFVSTRENTQDTNGCGFERTYANTSDIDVGNDTFEIKEYMCIDLTQMFPFDTPTVLTDVRVQAILNRGYIAYNTGTLKSVDMSEVSSEPYNLFDESDTSNRYNAWIGSGGTSGGTSASGHSIVIPIIGGLKYTVERTQTVAPRMRVATYPTLPQSSMTFTHYVVNQVSSATIQSGIEDNYIIVDLGDNDQDFLDQLSSLCIHLQGTRTGYAPYQLPQTLSLKYQGSGVNTSHDTMTIGNENVVFTKNVGVIDLGTLKWVYQDSNLRFNASSTVSDMKNVAITEVPNFINSGGYTVVDFNHLSGDMKISLYSVNKFIYIRDYRYTSASALKAALSGVYLYYALATPQTITIPRKRLGVIDLGSLNWTASFVTNNLTYCLSPSNAARFSGDVIANIYCVRFLTDKMHNVGGVNAVLETIGMGYSAGANTIYIKSKLISSSTDTQEKIQQTLSGILLFYETNEDVPDITNTIQIQAGGTITTNSNVLPNINFEVQCK